MSDNAYETIYLNRDPNNEWSDESTWCQDKINDDDIKYIRSDIVDVLRQRVKDLEDKESAELFDAKRIIKMQRKELAVLKQSHGEPVAWGLQVPGEEPYLRQIWIVKDGPFNQAKEHWPEAYKGAYQVPLYTAPTIPEGWQLVPIEPTEEMHDAYVNLNGRFPSARSDWQVMLAAAPKPEDVK